MIDLTLTIEQKTRHGFLSQLCGDKQGGGAVVGGLIDSNSTLTIEQKMRHCFLALLCSDAQGGDAIDVGLIDLTLSVY